MDFHDYCHKVEISYLVSFRALNRLFERFYNYSRNLFELLCVEWLHFHLVEFGLHASVIS